jgi:uncharacterized membrane protein YheB (UPF0754 family)
MQNWLMWCLPPVVGGIVGLATNDLAVRMLFRPLRPWYIGRWRIPFTPGLVPAEQDRLAEQMAATLVQNLLTPEDLRNLVTALLTQERLESLLQNALAQFLQHWTISTPKEQWVPTGSKLLADLVRTQTPVITAQITAHSLTFERLEPLVSRWIDALLPQLHLTPATAYFVTRQIMERLLTPEPLRLALLELLQPTQIETLGNFARSRTGGRYGILLSLLNLKDLLNKGRAFLADEPEQAHELLAELLLLARIEDTLYRQILHLRPDQWDPADQRELKTHLATWLSHYLGQQQQSLSTLWLEELDLEGLITPLLNRLNPSDLPWVQDELPHYLARAISHFLSHQADHTLTTLMRELPLQELIATKIKQFSPADLEALILSVSRRELRLIVILGGVLGFLIGLLQVALMALLG